MGNTYNQILAFTEPGRKNPFPPLDDTGLSTIALDFETPCYLLTDPLAKEEDGEDPFYLYLCLWSLNGANEELERIILRILATNNAPGSLPTGYRLFVDDSSDGVYLGAQFLSTNMDGTAFDKIVQDFLSYGRLKKEQLVQIFEELTQGSENTNTQTETLSIPPVGETFIRI